MPRHKQEFEITPWMLGYLAAFHRHLRQDHGARDDMTDVFDTAVPGKRQRLPKRAREAAARAESLLRP